MERQGIAVSIIIPIYNVETYLEKCLDSVVNQSLKNMEVICVDDGSTDLSSRILDKFGRNDSRIRVFHRTNAGYGSAVNFGIKQARGKYIGIVESDDFVLPEMYETLFNLAEQNDLEIVKSDFYLYNDKRTIEVHVNDLNDYYGKIITHASRRIFFKFNMYNWAGIYRRDFIQRNQISHLESPGASYQDTGFWFKIMSTCKRAMWIDKAFYMYRQDNPNSSIKSKDKIYAYYNEYENIEHFLLSRNLMDEWKLSNYYRMEAHRLSFYRIYDQKKLEYAKLIQQDYLNRKDNILWNGNESNNRELFEFLESIVESPEKFCERYFLNKEFMLNRIEAAKRIIIYGAGVRGEKVLRFIHDKGYFSKLQYIIDNKVACINSLGKQVYKLSECTITDDDLILVAIAKSTNAYTEVINSLLEKNIHNFIDTESIY